MKIAYLGPFINSRLIPFIDTLTEKDCQKSPGMGGRGFVDLVEEQCLRKKDITVITLDRKLNSNEQIVRKGDKCSLYSFSHLGLKGMITFYKREIFLIKKALNEVKPDIVHAHWLYEYALAGIKQDFPTLITAHDNPEIIKKMSSKLYLINYGIAKYVNKKAKFMTAVGPNAFEFINKKKRIGVYFVPNLLTTLFWNSIEDFKRDFDFEKPIIMGVLNWGYLKNAMTAVLAFNKILNKFKDAELHLFGSGLGQNEIGHKWCKERNLDKNVYFHGFVHFTKIIDAMKHATLLLHTSRFETCNMAIADAMALKLPIIGGYKSGGVPWQLDYGSAGLVVDIENPESVYRAMMKIINNKELRIELGNNAFERAKKLYDPNQVINLYEQIYKEVLDYY